MLDARLELCANLVGGEGKVADVGTDHAKLAAELVLGGKCKSAIASDVKEGPLEAAKKTVEKHGLSDKIELVLSDGLDNVPTEGVSDVVIAGMGGETIADIVGRAPASLRDNENVKWILQPMSKQDFLRKRLFELGMTISGEYVVEDGDKLYVVTVAKRSPAKRLLTEFGALYGFFDKGDELAKKHREREAERLAKAAKSLKKGGKSETAAHFSALSYKMKNGPGAADISVIYDCLDAVYPFATQEKWDNSGLLVENESMRCGKVLLSLDITNEAVAEAAAKGAELVISHHPVIFTPKSSVKRGEPLFGLIRNGAAAICMHTNADVARDGTNGAILRKIAEKRELIGEPEPFEELGGGISLGYIVELKEPMEAAELAALCKEIFGCPYVRANAGGKKRLSKIAFCSGSGGSLLPLAAEKGCDALITGDAKHDIWIDANNSGTALFDCGHFHTENLVLWEFRRVLEEKFPQLDVEIAGSSTDPCEYL